MVMETLSSISIGRLVEWMTAHHLVRGDYLGVTLTDYKSCELWFTSCSCRLQRAAIICWLSIVRTRWFWHGSRRPQIRHGLRPQSPLPINSSSASETLTPSSEKLVLLCNTLTAYSVNDCDCEIGSGRCIPPNKNRMKMKPNKYYRKHGVVDSGWGRDGGVEIFLSSHLQTMFSLALG